MTAISLRDLGVSLASSQQTRIPAIWLLPSIPLPAPWAELPVSGIDRIQRRVERVEEIAARLRMQHTIEGGH